MFEIVRKKSHRMLLRWMNVTQGEKGEVSIEYIMIAAGLLVLVYGAFTFLGGSVDAFVRGLPARLGF
ncbi:MAG: hypothetical protein HZB51_15340 [Chloroflexi bacterium]|nr:hypothetical protein [Chloroflexota bacterium]